VAEFHAIAVSPTILPNHLGIDDRTNSIISAYIEQDGTQAARKEAQFFLLFIRFRLADL
jgi:hypothetical protein